LFSSEKLLSKAFINDRIAFVKNSMKGGGTGVKITRKSLGRHILAEMYNCNKEILNDVEKTKEIMVNAAVIAGAEVVEVVFHKFSPYGVSGVVVISESHLAIHTWPEYGFASADLFTCGDHINPWKAFEYLNEFLQAEQVVTFEMKRGILPIDAGNFTYKPEEKEREGVG